MVADGEDRIREVEEGATDRRGNRSCRGPVRQTVCLKSQRFYCSLQGGSAPPFHSADGRTLSLLVNVGVATEFGFLSVYDVRESEPHIQNMAELIAPFSVQS